MPDGSGFLIEILCFCMGHGFVVVCVFSDFVAPVAVMCVCARPWRVVHIACGGPALRVHRAETMVDGLPRAASSSATTNSNYMRLFV